MKLIFLISIMIQINLISWLMIRASINLYF